MKTIRIENFNGIEVNLHYLEVMDKYSDKAKGILMDRSPKSHRPNRVTPYSTGWTVHKTATKKGHRYVIWNKTNWQLTHLLENGHFVTNRGALIWVQPRKHIRQTYYDVRDGYVREMEHLKIEADFK